MATPAPTKNRRTASREMRRRQLIDATMKCIARKGIGGTTLADVANEAGLSQGIVNLHFESKDNLLKETLKSHANDYMEEFDRTLKNSGPRPADRLLASLELDFKPAICNRRRLAIWFAFWGEVKSRPTYRRICAESDRYYEGVIEDLCAQLIDEQNYKGVSAAAAAEALTSMTNGLWLSCLINPQTWDPQKAMDGIMSYLRHVFPKHYRSTA